MQGSQELVRPGGYGGSVVRVQCQGILSFTINQFVAEQVYSRLIALGLLLVLSSFKALFSASSFAV